MTHRDQIIRYMRNTTGAYVASAWGSCSACSAQAKYRRCEYHICSACMCLVEQYKGTGIQNARPAIRSIHTLVNNSKYALGMLLAAGFRRITTPGTRHCDICITAEKCSGIIMIKRGDILVDLCVCELCKCSAEMRARGLHARMLTILCLTERVVPDVALAIREHVFLDYVS